MVSKPNRRREALRPSATQTQSSSNEVNDKELQKRVGMAVRLARTAKKMTQRELANSIGKSQNFIYTIETGRSDPGIVALRRIAEALHVSMDVFLAPVITQREGKTDAEQKIFNKAQELLVSILRSTQEPSGDSGRTATR